MIPPGPPVTLSKPFLPLVSSRISNEHSPKLQIRSHSYLRAVSEVSINRSLDSLDPAGLLTSPKFRSRNESYMRAMSTISQVRTIRVSVGVRHYGGELRGRGRAGEEGRHTGTIDGVDRKRSQTLQCRPHVHPQLLVLMVY